MTEVLMMNLTCSWKKQKSLKKTICKSHPYKYFISKKNTRFRHGTGFKTTQLLNIYEKNSTFKGKPLLKNWCNYCRRYGYSIAECRQKQQDNQNKSQKYREPNKSYYQFIKKKDQNLPNKNIHSKKFSRIPLPDNNKNRQHSPYRNNYHKKSTDRTSSQNFSQARYSRSNSQNNQYRNNYSRWNSNRSSYLNYHRNWFNLNSRNRYFSNNRSRNSSRNRNMNYSNNRNSKYSDNRPRNYSNNRSK